MTTVQTLRTTRQAAPLLACGGCEYDGASGTLQFDWRGVAASAVGAGVGQAVGGQLGNSFGGRLATGLIAGTAAAVMRGGKVAIQQVAVDAFGNALSWSVAGAAGQGSDASAGQQGDPLGDFIQDNMPAWQQRQANYDAMVGAFGGAQMPDRSQDVSIAGGPGYNMGSSVQDPDRFRAENLGRMRELARKADPGSIEYYRQPDGTVRIELNNMADDTPAYMPGAGYADETRTFPTTTIRASREPSTGSELLDEGIQRAGGTVLGVAGVVHGGAQFASDQFWALTNALSGGWLANNNGAAQAAVARNASLGQAIVNLPRQASGLALRAVTGNWNGAGQGVRNALNVDQINALNARGDYLGAQVLTTQSAINVAGVAAGGVGMLRAGATLTPAVAQVSTNAVSARHLAWGSDLGEVSASIERLGVRALRQSAGNPQQAERLFENYLTGVGNRFSRVRSEFGIEIQPAALAGGERVPNFIYLHRGSPSSPLITGSGGSPRLFAFPGSRRLDAGVIDTTAAANQHGLQPVIAGFDITVSPTKPNIVRYYQEYFGNIPVYDIRLPR